MHVGAAFGAACRRRARKTGYKMLKSASRLSVMGDIGAVTGQKGQEGLKESS
jgi:hypothetical protein